jgi:hypothetical protein
VIADPLGSVTTWSYFRGALLEQQMADEMPPRGFDLATSSCK